MFSFVVTVMCVITTNRHQQPDTRGYKRRARGRRAKGRECRGCDRSGAERAGASTGAAPTAGKRPASDTPDDRKCSLTLVFISLNANTAAPKRGNVSVMAPDSRK